MGLLRQIRIVAMRGYEKRMTQIMAIMEEQGFDETSVIEKEVKLVEEYRKLQREYLKLAEINRKEYEDAQVED